MKLAAAGAGRRVGTDGFPSGPWTPDLLATAISEIEGNKSGIEVRTVQLWFQENERGVSAENVRWLARIFGCDDPRATADWQVALSASLVEQKRQKRERQGQVLPVEIPAVDASETPPAPDLSSTPSIAPEIPPSLPSEGKRRFLLARASEALFSRGSPLDLPALVFAGAVALGFLSFIVGVHSVRYDHDDIMKQVGYLWSPNWTILFMILLPIFFGLVVESLLHWQREIRPYLIEKVGPDRDARTWMHHIEASSSTFWAVFFICIVFAGIIQWMGVRLGPLLGMEHDYAIDWGNVALTRPEVVTVAESIVFTGLAYLYMCLCFYALFVGLIIQYMMIYDFGKLAGGSGICASQIVMADGRNPARVVMVSVFRCFVLVILTATTMKLQNLYLR